MLVFRWIWLRTWRIMRLSMSRSITARPRQSDSRIAQPTPHALSVAGLVFTAILGIQTSHATTFQVTTDRSLWNPSDGLCDLDEALESASTNSVIDPACGTGEYGRDIILLPPGYFGEQRCTRRVITEPVTILGAGKSRTYLEIQLLAVESDIEIADVTFTASQPPSLDSSQNCLHLETRESQVTIRDVVFERGRGIAFRNQDPRIGRAAINITRTLIRDNRSSAAGGRRASGGILARGHVTLRLQDSTISRNSRIALHVSDLAAFGVSRVNILSPQVLVSNTTISGNFNTGGIVSGIFGQETLGNSAFPTEIKLVNCTMAGNVSASTSLPELNTAIFLQGHTRMFMHNTIIGANSRNDCLAAPAQGLPPDYAFVSMGHNLVSREGGCPGNSPGDRPFSPDAFFDEILGPLRQGTGPTPSHVPLAGSPAIDAGDPVPCDLSEELGLDQRGQRRPVDGDGDGSAACDIGSVEFNLRDALEQLVRAIESLEVNHGTRISLMAKIERLLEDERAIEAYRISSATRRVRALLHEIAGLEDRQIPQADVDRLRNVLLLILALLENSGSTPLNPS